MDPLQRLVNEQLKIMSASEQWLSRIQAGDLAMAQQINVTAIQPAYERHARIIEQVALLIEKNGTDMNNALSADAQRSGAIVLAIGTWPLAAGLLAVVVGLISILLLLPLINRLDHK